MAYEPFLLGVGVVFNLLMSPDAGNKRQQSKQCVDVAPIWLTGGFACGLSIPMDNLRGSKAEVPPDTIKIIALLPHLQHAHSEKNMRN